MKKIFMCILLGSIYLTGLTDTYCQEALNKGSYSLAGTINYSASSYKDDYVSYDSHIFIFAPQFVYFTGDHTALGIIVNYANYFQDYTMSSFSVGPSLRYYFYVEKFIPFLEADVTLTDPNLESSSGLQQAWALKPDWIISYQTVWHWSHQSAIPILHFLLRIIMLLQQQQIFFSRNRS